MTEEEKMLAGEIYDANNDKGLIEKRIIAKELCKKYKQDSFYVQSPGETPMYIYRRI